MLHLGFGTVTSTILCVLRRNMKINVTEKPPFVESFGKVNPSKFPANSWHRTSKFDSVVVEGSLQRLTDSKGVTLDRESVVMYQLVPRTRAVLILCREGG